MLDPTAFHHRFEVLEDEAHRLAIFGDANWSLQMREISDGRRPDAGFLLGSGLVMILPWTASTVVGHLFGQILGDPRRFGKGDSA